MPNTVQNKNDHDMLVTLNTKVDQLGFDIKDIKTDLLARVQKVEMRLDAMDLYHAKIPLEEYEKLAEWVKNLRSNFQVMLALGGIFMGIIGAVIARMLEIWIKP